MTLSQNLQTNTLLQDTLVKQSQTLDDDEALFAIKIPGLESWGFMKVRQWKVKSFRLAYRPFKPTFITSSCLRSRDDIITIGWILEVSQREKQEFVNN
jgi:hypothetical protein